MKDQNSDKNIFMNLHKTAHENQPDYKHNTCKNIHQWSMTIVLRNNQQTSQLDHTLLCTILKYLYIDQLHCMSLFDKYMVDIIRSITLKKV